MKFEEYIKSLENRIARLEAFRSRIPSSFLVEHDEDGHHTDITGDTLNLSGYANVKEFQIDSSRRMYTIRDEDDMASNDDRALVTQQSVKAYVDNLEAKKRNTFFWGYLTSDQSIPEGYNIPNITAWQDFGSNFSNSTHKYTVPYDGIYYVRAGVYIGWTSNYSSGGYAIPYIWHTTSGGTVRVRLMGSFNRDLPANRPIGLEVSGLLRCYQGDLIYPYHYNSWNYNTATYYSGWQRTNMMIVAEAVYS